MPSAASFFFKSGNRFDLVFLLIFNDPILPKVVKQQLSRLQVFLFASALQDEGLLRRASNPARRLLDEIVTREIELAQNKQDPAGRLEYLQHQIDGMGKLQFVTADHYAGLLEGYLKLALKDDSAQQRQEKQDNAQKVMPLVKERLYELTQPLRIQGTSLLLLKKSGYRCWSRLRCARAWNPTPGTRPSRWSRCRSGH